MEFQNEDTATSGTTGDHVKAMSDALLGCCVCSAGWVKITDLDSLIIIFFDTFLLKIKLETIFFKSNWSYQNSK